MDEIFYEMIHYLNDHIDLDVKSNETLSLTFTKYFNEINYTILVFNTDTKRQIYSNTYYHSDFETLFEIFNQMTNKISTMNMILKYNHGYQTFDLLNQ